MVCKRLQKRFWAALCAFLVLASASAAAQTTAVTGTVVDPSGIPYAGGTVLPQLVPAGGATPTLNGAFFVPSNSPARLDSSGAFSLTLQDNNQISPAGSKWKFTVCSGASSVAPAAGKGSVCFTPAAITITGASQDISAQLQAAALALSVSPATPDIGAATGTSLNLGGTGVLSTTAQSGTGSLCMTVNCALTTPRIGSGGFTIAGAIGGTTTIQTSGSATSTVLVQATSGGTTLVGRDTTDTLTNKTLNGASSSNSVTLLNTQGVTAALTGNSTDQTVYTYTLPALTVAASKGVRVTTSWAHTAGTASVAYKVFFGAATCVAVSSATTGAFYSETIIMNNPGVTTAQRCSSLTTSSSAVVQAIAGNAPAENTSTSIVIKLTFNVAATDQVAGGQFLVELIQ